MIKKRIAVGLDVGGTTLKCGLIEESGKLLLLRKRKTDIHKGRETILTDIEELIRSVLTEKRLTEKEVAGIGLGTPGYVVNGVIHGSPNMPGWHGTPIVKIMKSAFKTPFFASNDVTLAALAEYVVGQKRKVSNMIFYAIGTGIGGGLIIDGQVYEGSFGMAGELGHVIVEPGGRLCGCGIQGCVEAYSSTVGMVGIAKELLTGSKGKNSRIYRAVKGDLSKVTPKIIYDMAKEGDKVGLQINETVCRYLSMAMGGMINIINPDLVVLGGGVMQAGDIIMKKIKHYLPRYTLPDLLSHCRLDYAKLGEHAGVIGCGALVFQKLGANIRSKA
ncbi:MAG: hypothetical protein A2293_15875 [Elusimicrobia bacterium RIFOXYB2_FULL_49_7]|nr:MAG: hypothetical protein A2293_15875 [Elusimicrobia bacterium RIFOXYB2_FULL_49_7]